MADLDARIDALFADTDDDGKEKKAAAAAKPKPRKRRHKKTKLKTPRGKTAAAVKTKTKTKKPATKRRRTDAPPVAATVSRAKNAASAAASEVASYTVPGGTRKTKLRRAVSADVEQSAEEASPQTSEAPLPALAAGMARTFSDMPCLDSPFALDDWAQRYRDSSAHTASMEARQKSVADAIRASLRTREEEEEERPEPVKEITIEDFFSGDLDTPLVGSARDMHTMLSQLRTEIDRCESLSRVAAGEAEGVKAKVAQAEARRKKKRTRTKGAGAAASDDDGNDDDVVIHGATRTRLEACSRAYCAKYYREPRGEEFGERECARARDCVFVMMASRYPDTAIESTSEEGFVCREFLLPSQELAWKKEEGTLPETRQLCIGCNRMLTTFYYYMYKARDESPVELIQTHYNPVGTPGEYDAARCLHPNPDPGKWTGIARPFVEFAANTFIYVEYEITAKTTGRCWNLLGVKEVMTDFRLSPSSYYRGAAEDAEATARVVAGTDDGEPVGLAQDPRGAWVCGLSAIAIMRGVPPCRPLRPPEWIGAEEAACPSAPGFRAPTPLAPRLLLGRAYPAYAKYVFCPFDETLAYTRENAPSVAMAFYPRLAHAASMYSFDRSLLDAILADVRASDGGDSLRAQYKILLAVLYRLDMATRLLGRGEDRRYDYWIQLFVDTHIDLCIAMHTSGIFDDTTLDNPDLNPNSVSESIFAQNIPHDARCLHAGDLPDLSACVQFAGVWFQIRAKARAENVVEALVHLVACKTQTHKCQVRNFANIAYGYASEFPQIMTLFRALLAVSLLGNYPHAQHRPDFAARLHVAYSIRPEVSTDREVFLWIAENDELAYAIVKEYYRYLVAQRPAFEAVLEETTHWEVVRDYICDAMDRARTVAALSVGDGTLSGRPYGHQRPGYGGHGPPRATAPAVGGDKLLHRDAMRAIAADMKKLHEHSELPLITKLRKGTFSAIIVSEMSAFFTHSILEDHSIRPQTSLISLAKLDGDEAAADIVRGMRDVVTARVPRRESREPIETRWLAYFGVTNEGLAALRALYYDYENKDIADNSIKTRIRAMYDHSTRDFFVIHTFFTIVSEWRATASFKLPLCYAESQAAVLRAKTFTPPWKPLSPRADVFYWCQSCLRWLSDTVDITDPDTRENMYSINFNHTLYSHDTGGIYCDRQKVSVNTRKQVESGEYTSLDARIDDVREARRVRHYLSTPACCSAPAVPVHMLGRCQRLGGKLWALCECCAALTQWEGAKFNSTGFSCGFHDADAPRNMTEHQKEELRLRRRREKIPLSDACSFCERTIKPGEDYSQITVLDDCGYAIVDPAAPTGYSRTAPTWKYRPYALCRVDSTAIRSEDAVLRLSVVEHYIRRAREWRMKNAQKRYGGRM